MLVQTSWAAFFNHGRKYHSFYSWSWWLWLLQHRVQIRFFNHQIIVCAAARQPTKRVLLLQTSRPDILYRPKWPFFARCSSRSAKNILDELERKTGGLHLKWPACVKCLSVTFSDSTTSDWRKGQTAIKNWKVHELFDVFTVNVCSVTINDEHHRRNERMQSNQVMKIVSIQKVSVPWTDDRKSWVYAPITI